MPSYAVIPAMLYRVAVFWCTVQQNVFILVWHEITAYRALEFPKRQSIGDPIFWLFVLYLAFYHVGQLLDWAIDL